MKKVLIGIPTYARGGDSLQSMLSAIASFDYPADLLFVDNSPADDYLHYLQSQGLQAIKSSSIGSRASKIIAARNTIREFFLQGNWDYLLFLDSDVIAPAHTLRALLALDKACSNGIYKLASYNKEQKIYLPDIWQWVDPLQVPPGQLHLNALLKQLTLSEIRLPVKRKIAVAGLGCCLIRRDILMQISFTQYSKDDTGGEDFAFFLDLKRIGEEAWVDMGVLCFHQCFPEGDPRNLPYQFI